MKWILCVAVFTCVLSKIVNGARPNKPKQVHEIKVLEVDSDNVIYGPDDNYLEEGIRNKKITCKGSLRNQKIEWYDPEGNLVTRDPTNRVYVLEPLLSPKPMKTLVFTTTDMTDTGIWECRSDDLVQAILLCVMDSAEFVDTKSEITTDVGRSVTLSCQAKGNPEPAIQWYRDGNLIVEDDEKFFLSTKYNQHGYEGLLTIKSVGPEDMGVYVCEAAQANPLYESCINNSVTFNVTLNVNHAPSFVYSEDKEIKREYVFAEDGENVTLICDPTAYPVPEFRWFSVSGNMDTEFSNKQFIVSEDGTRSIFPLIANSSTYNKKFQCKATNDFGKSIMTYQILRLQKPVELKATSEFVPRERTIYFNITWNEEIVFPVDSYDVEYFEKTAIGEPREWQWSTAKVVHYKDDGTLIVPLKNLKINTEYWVRIRACNQLGEGPWSSHILASTAYDIESTDVGIFLGVIVTAVIVVIGAACIHVVKKL